MAAAPERSRTRWRRWWRGYSKYVVVYRGLAQGQFGRFGQGPQTPTAPGPGAFTAPYGLLSPAQSFAMRIRRFMHDHGAEQSALRAISMATYRHAQSNPRAVMYGRELTEEMYDNSRMIVEPFHLFDCCQENDGAAALIVTSAERAKDMKQKPAWVLSAAQGSDYRQAATAHNSPDYATSNFKTLAPRLYAMAGLGPEDVDVLQSYENFTGGVLMSIVEHGFCEPDEVNDFFTLENFSAPDGKLPLNTSGGQPGGVLHARPRAGARGGAAGAGRLDLPGTGRERLDGDVGADGAAGE